MKTTATTTKKASRQTSAAATTENKTKAPSDTEPLQVSSFIQ